MLEGLLAADEGRAEVFASWHTYQVIGDVLRGNRVAAHRPRHPATFWPGCVNGCDRSRRPWARGGCWCKTRPQRWCRCLRPMTRFFAGRWWPGWPRWRPSWP
ncbi:hypothetical protein ACFJGX_11540 [Hydrogenophaga sp. UC242_50]|uniref:hypothetical protein n=1 Tax=Hydrogenophaga sp. UC242_50 TaxID=3350169 RepID=UPI0036D2DF97